MTLFWRQLAVHVVDVSSVIPSRALVISDGGDHVANERDTVARILRLTSEFGRVELNGEEGIPMDESGRVGRDGIEERVAASVSLDLDEPLRIRGVTLISEVVHESRDGLIRHWASLRCHQRFNVCS
jgi:hypothetical protein